MRYVLQVVYRVVPGLTFAMCQSGTLTAAVDRAFREAIRWLDEDQHVDAITGDCGFMFWFQDMARRQTSKPVLLSSLVQLPAITCGFAKHKVCSTEAQQANVTKQVQPCPCMTSSSSPGLK